MKKVFDEFSRNGMPAELHRKNDDGTLSPASEKDLHVLSVKARYASTAQALTVMTRAEKTIWAIEMKDVANELFRNGI